MPYLDKRGRTCGFLNVEEKENSGRFSRRYFILTKDEKFQYYMDNPHNLPHNARKPIGEISLQFISKVSDARKLRPKVDSCFVVNYAGNVMYLQADDDEDMRKWVEALNNASKITVPKNEDRHSMEANEWHHKGVAESGFTTDIAGGVVCKMPLQTTSEDDTSPSSDGEFDSHGVPANMLTAIKAGYCVKQGGMRKNWKRRYFVLNEQGLLYFQSEKAKEPLRLIPRHDIQEVKKNTSSTHHTRDNLLEIVTPKRTFYIQCDDPDSMFSWINTINKSFSLVPREDGCQMVDSLQRGVTQPIFDENFPVTKVYPHGEWSGSEDTSSTGKSDRESTRQKKKSWLLW